MSIFYFLKIIWVAITFSAVSANPLSQPLKKLDEHIQHQVQEGRVVGCAVAVIAHGKIVFIKAYGVRKKGEKSPVNLHTTFQLGSIAKPITATLVALLQKQNILLTDATVVNYYPNISPATKIKDLLSHTSGYTRSGWNHKIEAGVRRDKLLRQLANSKQNMPGRVYDYHNIAYSLIQEVIEKTCQQSFNTVMNKRLFNLLQMQRTSVGYENFQQQQNRAWPHQKDKSLRWQPSKQYSYLYHEAVCASAGINSSIKDMATFLQLQMGGIPEVLKPNDLASFHTPRTIAPDAINWFKGILPDEIQSYYGMGWRIVDYQQTRLIFHGGWVKGFCNFLGFIPTHQIGIVILHNAESGFAIRTAMMFFDLWKKGGFKLSAS